MVLTDHWSPPDELERIGNRMQAGLPVDYPEERVEDYIRLFEKTSPEKLAARRFGGCILRLSRNASESSLVNR
jgi:hypothetical protein